MTKVCIVQKRQIVLLKKEIYVEGSQEEIEEWIIHNQLDDTKYQWRTHTEYIDPGHEEYEILEVPEDCLLYTSPSPRDRQKSRMPSSA